MLIYLKFDEMVQTFLKNGGKLFLSKQTTIFSAAAIIAISILASRVLGLFRYRLLAAFFGGEIETLDAFIAASIIPEAIFEILIFGSISVAFIPVFSAFVAKGETKKAWVLASSVLNLGLLTFFVLSLLLFIFSPHLPSLVAPGLARDNPQIGSLMTGLIRVMILSQLFFVVSVFLTGILQSFGHFLFPALAAVFYNLGIIAGIVFLSPFLGIYGPAWGMVLGALLHFLVQLPLAMKVGTKFHFVINFGADGVKQVVELMWPRALNLLVIRLNDFVNIALASLLASGSIVALNFAQTLQFVPVGLFGASLAQASLPILSTQAAHGNTEEFKRIFMSAVNQIIFLCLPTMALLSILRVPAVRLVFGASQFPWELTLLTGQVLIILSLSIVTQSLSLLLVRGFYAFHDPKTPVACGFFSIVLNIILSFVFIKTFSLPIHFLAVSYFLGSFSNVFLLMVFLDRKIHFDRRTLFLPGSKILLATLIMLVFLYVPFKLFDFLLDTARTFNLLVLTVISGTCGLFAFFATARLLGIEESRTLFRVFSKVNFTKKVEPQEILT